MGRKYGSMVLGENCEYSLDCKETKRNNNVLVVGTSGAGKTRGIVIPNLLMATGSYVISDPKGNLYDRYKKYLQLKGYSVKKLDFTNPGNSLHYNFFQYIRNTQDIMKVAHMLMAEGGPTLSNDRFWDDAGQLLLQGILGYICETCQEGERNLDTLLQLADSVIPEGAKNYSVADELFNDLERRNPDSFAVKSYRRFKVCTEKTLRSICITLNSRLALWGTPEILEMTSYDETEISQIGQRKTALFVVVSDTDRSMDGMADIFFSQAINELCRYADTECKGSELPVPVRFILDDFATNCKINDFPRMISSIRSRGISTMLMIQAESQLEEGYGKDARTIVGNCDTYVYLGGNDIETARRVAERCDVPMKKILNMPVGTCRLFRRGEEPRTVQIINPDICREAFTEESSLVTMM